ncbi:MAG: hypothetical protein ACI92X_002024 [Dokdonia sp.]|jgi:hypothetical protein
MSTQPKNLSGKQISALRIVAFNEWTASMTEQDYVSIIEGGQLNRTTIAEQCVELYPQTNFDRQCLTKNKKLIPLLNNLEDGLRASGVLPELTYEGEIEQKKPTLNRKSIKAAQEQSRVPFLEQRIIELESELEATKGQLGRFSELSETMQELSEF